MRIKEIQKLLSSGRINLKMIRYFLTVADELHFGRAATRLHMSQPPLSAQIKELEDTLGFPLFIRDSRNVVLTLAGEALQLEMGNLFENIENAFSRVSYIARNEQSHLNIGVIGSAMWHELLDTLDSHQKEAPQTTWSLIEMPPYKQQDALLNKKIDVGFWRVVDSERHPDLVYHNVNVQKIKVAVPSDSPFAKKSAISLRELDNQVLIFLPFHHSAFSQHLYNQCLKAGCKPKAIHQFNEPQTQLAFVKRHLGIALVPETTQEIPWPNINFISLKEQLSADLFAVYHPDYCSDTLISLLNSFNGVRHS